VAEWRLCSACKKPIQLGADYYACNVSTCNRKRTSMVFCSVTCWEVHLPVANHRESWAVEKKAPLSKEAPSPVESPRVTSRDSLQPAAGAHRIVHGRSENPVSGRAPTEILIVASRLKEYIRAKSGYKTSERVLDPLSDIVRKVCDEAIRNAQRDGRMTVLDRDIPED
jgi:hypothetical protein